MPDSCDGKLDAHSDRRLKRWEKFALGLFCFFLLAFGVITEIRSAFLKARQTDFGVYARAAWAVRAGEDLYTQVDDRGWHYCYPPIFAILLTPLADPYPWLPRENYLPFAVSVAIWFLLSVCFVGYAVHAFAEAVMPETQRFSRRWWYARMIPVFICIGGIGFTLGRGQVNLLLLALIAASFAATIRGRSIVGGVWLAAAVALKIIPGLLLLFPMVRRDWRGLSGVSIGAAMLFGAIPFAVWGVPKAIEMNWKPIEVVIGPAILGGGDKTRAIELHGAKSTDSQSVRAATQAWLYPDRSSRPNEIDPIASAAHWLVALILVISTVLVGYKRLTSNPADQLIFLGALTADMMLITPISHMHYYAMILPLVCGLWLKGLSLRYGEILPDRRTSFILASWGILTAIPLFPGPIFDRLRECGFGTACTIGLLAFAIGQIGRGSVASGTAMPHSTQNDSYQAKAA